MTEETLNNRCDWLAGETEIHDRTVRGLLLSAARSVIFNACVGERVQRRCWDTPLDGEVFGFADNRSLILPANLRGDEERRFQEGIIELTAPLWGEGDLVSQLQVLEMEEAVAQQYPEITSGLTRFGLRQERRVIRLMLRSQVWNGKLSQPSSCDSIYPRERMQQLC